MNYTLETFDFPTNWNYVPLHKDECHKIQVGDCVRLLLNYNGGWQKIYVEIDKLDRYKYGGINKIRKFHGHFIEVYNECFDVVQVGDKVSFRRENILEIPGWKRQDFQPNRKVLDEERIRLEYEDWKLDEYKETKKKDRKRKERAIKNELKEKKLKEECDQFYKDNNLEKWWENLNTEQQ